METKMKTAKIAIVSLLCLFVASCADQQEINRVLEAVKVRTYAASPEEVIAAARAAMEELGKDSELTIWRENDDSFFATIREFQLHSLATNYVYYNFTVSEKAGKTEARAELEKDVGNLIKTRFEMYDLSKYETFWSLLEKFLGEKASVQEQTSGLSNQ